MACLFFVSGIITELSAASEFITCGTATGNGADKTLYKLFMSQADVDGVESRQTRTLLLSNVQAETEN